jgi:hypothetical protein
MDGFPDVSGCFDGTHHARRASVFRRGCGALLELGRIAGTSGAFVRVR